MRFPNLGATESIRDKLVNAPNYGKFLHKLLIQEKCYKDEAQRLPVPEFNMLTWPNKDTPRSAEKFLEKVKKY